jgi:hypothetical protein
MKDLYTRFATLFLVSVMACAFTLACDAGETCDSADTVGTADVTETAPQCGTDEASLTITVIVEDENGKSSFEDRPVAFEEAALLPEPSDPVTLSAPEGASAFMFLEVGADWKGVMHKAPGKQLAVIIRGTIDVEVSGGERRSFCPGDVIILEDVAGEGHLTIPTGTGSHMLMFVQYPTEEP